MVVSDLDELRTLLTVDPAVPDAAGVIDDLARTRSVLRGHFALRRGQHTRTALRFRAIGRDGAALEASARRVSDLATWDWANVKILSPESAGFFLGAALAKLHAAPHAVAQTDLMRAPTDRLVTGSPELARDERVVLVNDVASSGASLDPLRDLAARSGARVIGACLFSVVGFADFSAYCHRHRLVHVAITVAHWPLMPPGAQSCSGCESHESVVPIAELS